MSTSPKTLAFEEIVEAHGDPTDPATCPTGQDVQNALYVCRTALEQHRTAAGVLLNRAKDENRELRASEQRLADEALHQMRMINLLIEGYDSQARRSAHARVDTGQTGERRTGGATVGADPVYRRGTRHSYFADLVRSRIEPTPDVTDRLNRHAAEMDRAMACGDVDKVARKWATRDNVQGLEYRTNPNRTDGQGGYFVPPLYLLGEYVDYARAGRAFADLFRPIPLPTGTDSINLPKIATGSATGIQTADAASVTSTDLTDTVVTGPVRTIAGQQDFAQQLLDQSPVSIDEVIFRDLLSDYNQKLDLQCINGSGTSGQCLGVLNVSGINSVTYTDASPTLPEMWVPILQAASKVANGVFLPPTAIAMSASQWYWAASQLDTTNRPLLGGAGPMNSFGSFQRAAENQVGSLSTWPVIGDANIPANLGGGSNESRIITAAWDELFLFEGTPRTRVLTEVLSGTLQVRVQLYNYVATIPHRRPTAISVISGTGLAAPSGF